MKDYKSVAAILIMMAAVGVTGCNAVIEAMIEITPTNIATRSGMRDLAIATTTLTATIGIDRKRIESRR